MRILRQRTLKKVCAKTLKKVCAKTLNKVCAKTLKKVCTKHGKPLPQVQDNDKLKFWQKKAKKEVVRDGGYIDFYVFF